MKTRRPLKPAQESEKVMNNSGKKGPGRPRKSTQISAPTPTVSADDFEVSKPCHVPLILMATHCIECAGKRSSKEACVPSVAGNREE